MEGSFYEKSRGSEFDAHFLCDTPLPQQRDVRKQMSIEVERKFRLSSDPVSGCPSIDAVAASLESAGATLVR